MSTATSHDHDHGHDHGHGLKHYHDEDMQSVAAGLAGDVEAEKFMPWINRLMQEKGQNILRWKGILAFKGEPKRFVFQGVHMMLDGELQREWKPDEKRNSKVVFIGRNLAGGGIRAVSRLRRLTRERRRKSQIDMAEPTQSLTRFTCWIRSKRVRWLSATAFLRR